MSANPVQVVQAVYEGFSRRDLPKVFSLFAADLEIFQSEQLPWGGHFRGHAGAQEFFARLTSRLNSTLEIERYISAGEQVAAVGWTQGTVIATGAKYRVPIAHIWKVHYGLVVQVQFLIDHPTMLTALASPGHL
jgi:ketosteroid isomerase-like protein